MYYGYMSENSILIFSTLLCLIKVISAATSSSTLLTESTIINSLPLLTADNYRSFMHFHQCLDQGKPYSAALSVSGEGFTYKKMRVFASNTAHTIWSAAEEKALERNSHAMKRWEQYQQK